MAFRGNLKPEISQNMQTSNIYSVIQYWGFFGRTFFNFFNKTFELLFVLQKRQRIKPQHFLKGTLLEITDKNNYSVVEAEADRILK